MKITKAPEPSLLSLFLGTIIFLLAGIAALYYGVTASLDISESMSSQKSTFMFEKSLFYLYGVGVGLLVYPFLIIYKNVLKLTVNESMSKWASIILLASVALTFILPQIMHYYIDTYTEENNYQICREQSHRWLHVVTIVYAKDGQCLSE